MPNLSMKLMAKLGAKTRQYGKDTEIKPRNYSEDGLKVCLKDKHSQKEIIFGIDAVLDVLLVKILCYCDLYQPAQLLQAINFVKCAFLSYLDPDLDMSYITASIIAQKQSGTVPSPNQFQQSKIPSFNAKRRQHTVNQMSRGPESHVFEKILRCLMIGCSSLPTNTPEQTKVNEKHMKFMKWVTKYFTLIYICKNGELQKTNVDEINPLLFIEFICEFIYYNVKIFENRHQDRPYYKGSLVALETMLELLDKFYGDQPEIFDRLEVIHLLIKKVCFQERNTPKNLAVNIAIQLLVDHLPKITLKSNYEKFLDTLFQITNTSSNSVVRSIEREIKPVMESFLKAVGIFDENDLKMNDPLLFNKIIDKILCNLLSPQKTTRDIVQHLMEKIAKENSTTVLEILQEVPCSKSLSSNPQVRQEGKNWINYLQENEVERKAREIFEMFKGSFTQVQHLIQYIEVVQFVLKHNRSVRDKLQIYLGISEYILLVLEDECERFEKNLEPQNQPVGLGPNSSIQKMSNRYMKLERNYLTQNKEYDSYSHTMHTHQFLKTYFFEVSAQAKDQKQQNETKKIKEKQSQIELKIFEASAIPFEHLTEEAKRVLLDPQEHMQVKNHIRKKVDDFTTKMFGQSNQPPPNPNQQRPQQNVLKVQDISYKYLHDLFEMYPNVKLHCELVCKCMELLCDITSHRDLTDLFKVRQTELFETEEAAGNQGQPQQQPPPRARDPAESHLKTKFDFYMVEIKAKIICIYFKFFQRDERIVQKTSKQCLKRLLMQETLPNEALPNSILKECVRPILNSIHAYRNHTSQYSFFQHFAKLIKVLYSCFNDNLTHFLIKNLDELKISIINPYQLIQQRRQMTEGANGVQQQTSPQRVAMTRQQVQDELSFLIDQYNLKVLQIETAIGIINSLHYLSQHRPTMRPRIDEVMQTTLDFENTLIKDFEGRFEQQLNSVLDEPYQRMKPQAYERLTPLQMKMAYLKSELRDGVAKFFNLNYNDVLKCFRKKELGPIFIQILNQEENFILRERLSRDLWINRVIQSSRTGSRDLLVEDGSRYNKEFVLVINLVYIFSKFYPDYLIQQKNNYTLDNLREKWINKISKDQFMMHETKDIYMKIQKSLIIYCKHEDADNQLLFDLLKEFSIAQVYLDLRPLVQLCTEWIPQHASDSRKVKIMETCLNKIITSSCHYETKYTMFEFAFMPIALECANNRDKFERYFTRRLIVTFIDNFFNQRGKSSSLEHAPTEWIWECIQQDLEMRQKVAYQSFFTEIIKVLTIIMKWIPSFAAFKECCKGQSHTSIFKFLDWVTKRPNDQSLKEHAFYALSCFGMRMLNHSLDPSEESPQILDNAENHMSEGALSLLKHNVLAPFFEMDFTKPHNKALVQNTFMNLQKIFEDPRIRAQPSQVNKNQIWEAFRIRYKMKPERAARITLCSLMIKEMKVVQSDDEGFFRRLRKTILHVLTHIQQGIDQNDMKELFLMLDTMLAYQERRKSNAKTPEQFKEVETEAIHLQQMNSHLFEEYLKVHPSTAQLQQNGANTHIKTMTARFRKFADRCLSMVDKIGSLVPKPSKFEFKRGEALDSEKSTLKALYRLNICSMAIRKEYDFPNIIKLLDDHIRSSYEMVQQPNARHLMPNQPLHSYSSADWKLILMSIHLTQLALQKRQRLFSQQSLGEFEVNVRNAIKFDIKKSVEREFKFVQGQIVRDFQSRNVPMSLVNQQPTPQQQQALLNHKRDEVKVVQKCLPHFSIRMINRLESMRADGVISSDAFDRMVGKQSYIDINMAIFKMVSMFRYVICSESLEETKASDPKSKKEEKSQGYLDFEFDEGKAEFVCDEPDYKIWIKETIMTSLKSIVIFMKRKMHQDEAFGVLDVLKKTLEAFLKFRTCDYLIEQLYEVTKLLVTDEEGDRIKLVVKEKTILLYKILNAARIKEIIETKQIKDKEESIVNKIYSLSLDFLETQPSLLQNNDSLRIFDRLHMLRQCCSFDLRSRTFQIFEKFCGASLKAKLMYFFQKLTLDDYEVFLQFCKINNLLDFTLFNFRQDVGLHSIKGHSSNLPRLSSNSVTVSNFDSIRESEQGKKIMVVLDQFGAKFQKYQKKGLNDVLEPLSEIIKMNPEHSPDKNIAEKIFSKVFWQYWHILERQDQQYMAEGFNKLFSNMIKFSSVISADIRTQFARTMLEQVVALQEPQVRLEPEILQYLGKHFNLWHVAIPQLEDHVQLYPRNERYVNSLQELYSGLMEEDLSAGLSRITTESEEMRTLITYGQHHNWEQINSQFTEYINFYAEQEGLFSFLEKQQGMPGKYSRKLAKDNIMKLSAQPKNVAPNERWSATPEQTQAFSQLFETPKVAAALNQKNFPKAGSNRKISELDLRTFESLYINSLKILKKQELFRDIADQLNDNELKMDHYWLIKNVLKSDRTENIDNMSKLREYCKKVINQNQGLDAYFVPNNSIQKVRYHLYYNFILGSQMDRDANSAKNYDENFKETWRLAIKQWGDQLPSYTDRIQNEYLILFQQIMESNETRNMIQEVKQPSEIRCAINIWRERLPHICEGIQSWQEILENRNFIFQKLKDNISEGAQRQAQANGQSLSAISSIVFATQAEQTDSCWNNLKLAEVARKHGLLNLANNYLQGEKALLFSGEKHPEVMKVLKFERFKHFYESLKLQMIVQSKGAQKNYEEIVRTMQFDQSPEYDLWMKGDIHRLHGKFNMQRGNIVEARKEFIKSIGYNRKEAKTWIAYAKMNELIHREKRDEKSIANALKGYLCAVTLAQHKARMIIPYIFSLLKMPSSRTRHDELAGFVKGNVEQMPTWLWIFWLPQILQAFKMPLDSLQLITSKFICVKIVRFYPQTAYYEINSKQSYWRQMHWTEFQKYDRELSSPQLQRLLEPERRQSLTQIRRSAVNGDTEAQSRYIQAVKELKGIRSAASNTTTMAEIHKYLQKQMRGKIPKLFEGLDTMRAAIGHVVNQSKDDNQKLLAQLQVGLNLSQFLNREEQPGSIEQQLNQYYRSLPKFLDIKEGESVDPIKQQISDEFRKYFIEPATEEPDILEKMKILKNIKDFILIQKVLKEQQQHLAAFQPILTSMQTKGIELPGQHVLNASEPLPEKIISIESLEPVLQFTTDKKIQFKCNNSKSYAFSVQLLLFKDFDKFCSDERVTQLKVISNMVFAKHKETMRRGVKFYAAPQILFPGYKLVQDDLTFADFQTTHDYLLEERGLDPDLGLLTQMQHVKEHYNQLPEGVPKVFASIDQAAVKKINSKCYQDMRKDVKSSLLSSYFHRIFYNVDNLFMFKKQFTKYHAINSLFAYAFNQAEYLNLDSLSFCKATGRINFAGTQLKYALNRPQVFNDKSMEEIEEPLFRSKEDEPNLNYLPFRLTSNLEHFIGKIGIQGLFAGVMTSASMAVSASKDKYLTVLKLLFMDEIKQDESETEAIVTSNANYCLWKIRSLSQHERILTQPAVSEESKALAPEDLPDNALGLKIKYDYGKNCYKLGENQVPLKYFDLEVDRPRIPEEYNRKVFALIDMALDEERRSQKALNWCSWF